MELPDRTRAKSWEGKEVLDLTGQSLGTCVGVFADADTEAAEWLLIDVVGRGRSLVPAVNATQERDAVRLAFPRELVLTAPSVGDAQQLAKRDEMTLYRHYDVPFTDSASQSLLPEEAVVTDSAQDVPVLDARRDERPSSVRATAEAPRAVPPLPAAPAPLPAPPPPVDEGPRASNAPPASETVPAPTRPAPPVPPALPVPVALPPVEPPVDPPVEPPVVSAPPPEDEQDTSVVPAPDPEPVPEPAAAAVPAAAPAPTVEPMAITYPPPPVTRPVAGEQGRSPAMPSAAVPVVVVGGVVAAVWVVLHALDRRARRRRSVPARTRRAGRHAVRTSAAGRKAAAQQLAWAAKAGSKTRHDTQRQLSGAASTIAHRTGELADTLTAASGAAAKRTRKTTRKARRSAAWTLWELRMAAAVATGYVAGARAGRKRYDEITKVASATAARPEVQRAKQALLDPQRRATVLTDLRSRGRNLLNRVLGK